ncbi:hypothetical protein M2475_001642 [Breznakia sp. PF5-3]|uniref:SdrD B-like domain-containing protein n=1 Tax=unclassified Breznakia TaxID=2623764 RepID=UPI002404EA93|nr:MULTISPECIES: SdrD B-like domain-containing protein [unclassified Breznakia]MDF9825685.1 hypothetical protein [Breznakia sp. PM6-1]MDF9836066.1 hypothetical protein [Breznakia sp. PF5-3]MDF9838285.1 hypothetical protein [Breznakia sp. PFB2-8]MDF9860319.1 hypothetical protein [Breznakia sp. PH5-24]
MKKNKKRIYVFLASLFIVIAQMVTPAFSQEGQTRTEKIANVDTQVKFDKTIVQPGETFVLQLQINSVAISEELENQNGIQNLNLSFDIPESVEIKKMPTSSAFTITQTGQTITISGNADIRVAKLFLMDFEMAYKAGKYPTDVALRTFTPVLKVSANNANVNQPLSSSVTLEVKEQQTPILSLRKEDKWAHVVHTATIDLTPELRVGGLDHVNASVRIDLPEDIILYSAMYNGTNYPIQNDSNGKYIEVPIGVLQTIGTVQTIVLNYKYDFVEAEDERIIKVTYTGVRDGVGTPVVEKGEVKDIVYPLGSGTASDGTVFFRKEGSSTVIRESGQKVIYELELRPEADLKDVYLVDDPLANESEYFDALRFAKISWNAKTSVNPSLKEVVKTKVSYQTNKHTSWKAVSSQYTASGQINISDLNLEADEYVTKVKYDFNYNGSSEIPIEAGKVVITMEADTLLGIQNKTEGLNDGLTNTLRIYGKQKDVGATSFTDIKEEDDKNVRTFTTTYIERGAGLGLSNPLLSNDWDSMYSPRNPAIGDTFTYTINMNNVDGSGDLLSGAGYFILPSNVDFKKVELVNPNNAPDATFETRSISGGRTLVIVHYNRDIPRSYYNNQYAVRITAVAKSGTSATYYAYFASENENQKYVHTTYPTNIETVGTVPVDSHGSRYQTVNFLQHVDLEVSKEASLNGVDYANNINLTEADWNSLTNQEVYYKISVKNNSSSKFAQLRIIDMLPELSDSLVVTDTPKNSTLVPEFLSLSYTTSSGASVEYAFSEDAVYDKNADDLTDFTTDYNTWVNFNGSANDASYRDANALRIDIKNLDQSESIEFIVKMKMPKPTNKVKVAWNSVAYGGKLDTGTYIIPGEPYKSGIYSSTYEANAQISGVAWEDTNGNDMKDVDEPLFKNVPVKLLDAKGDIVAETITGMDGHYEFTGLFPGKYTVELEFMGPQYYLSKPNVGSDDVNNDFVDWDDTKEKAAADVVIAEGEKRINVDAGFYRILNIGDLVWNDENANGQYDANEKGISNYEMTLIRLDNDEKETTEKYTASTNTSGRYAMYQIKPGKYKMVATPKTGYFVSPKGTSPDGNIFTLNEDEGVWESGVLEFKSGVNDMNNDLGMYQSNQTISGSIFYDLDYDSVYNANAGDQVFSDNVDDNDIQILKVELLDNTHTVIDEADIESDGGFIFTEVDPGEYYVQISINEEYEEYLKCAPKFVSTTRGIANNDVSIFHEDTILSDKISIAANVSVSDQNLGLQPYYDLTIIKEDEKDNKRLQGAEFMLSKNGTAVGDNQVSDEDGEITYEKIKAGDYELKEVKAPKDYKKSDKTYELSIKDIKTFKLSYTVTNDKLVKNDVNKKPDKAGSMISNIANSIATGDYTNYMLWVGLVVGSLGFLVYKRKPLDKK